MSVTSWKKEFYVKPRKGMTWAAAVDQAIQKFTGAKKSNLRRHSLVNFGGVLANPNSLNRRFVFGTEECALCINADIYANGPDACRTCPLWRVVGDPCRHEGTPFSVFEDEGDVGPMLTALRKARKIAAKMDIESGQAKKRKSQ